MNNCARLSVSLLSTDSALYAGEGRGEAGWMLLKVPLGARGTSLGWTGLTQTSGAAAIEAPGVGRKMVKFAVVR